MKTVDKTRQIGLDIIRVLATFLVISVHFFLNTKYYDTPTTSLNMDIQTIIKNICLSCVPLFMILTGYLNNKKEYNKSFFKSLLNILIVWLFYSIVEFFSINIINGTTQNINTTNFLYNITSFHAASASWYINMYIGLFLMTPIINNAYNNFDQKNRKIMLLISLFLTFIPEFINPIFKGVFALPDYWIYLYPLCYYIIGKYISDTKPIINKRTLLVLFILTQIITISLQLITNVYYESLPILMQSVIIFLFFYNINIDKNFIRKPLIYLSNISLDIYLASAFFDQIIYPLFSKQFNFTNLPQEQIIYYAPLIVPIVFILSTILGSIRKLLIKVR